MVEKARRVLLPFEYTRVDNIVDLVFATQQETESKAITASEELDQESDISVKSAKYEFTPTAALEAKRMAIIAAFFVSKNAKPKKHSKTNYSDVTGEMRGTFAISKRYNRDYQPYWYALHPAWVDFMQGGKDSYFVLGFMDRDEAFAIPFSVVEKNLSGLNRTELPHRGYWHISLINDDGTLKWNIPKQTIKIDLTPYRVQI